MRNPDLNSSLLIRVLHFTGAITLSAATFYGVTALRQDSYNLSIELAVTGGIALASLMQFWMGEVLQHLSRHPEMQRARSEVPDDSAQEAAVRVSR